MILQNYHIICTQMHTFACVWGEFNNYSIYYLTVAELKAEVEMVRSAMAANIEKVLERGEQLDSLEEKADDLSNQAMMFQVKIQAYSHSHL